MRPWAAAPGLPRLTRPGKLLNITHSTSYPISYGGPKALITQQQERQWERWALGVILLGAVLRFWALDFGLPFVYHPDEHNLTFHAMEAGAQGGNPGWFEYPSLMMYLLGALYLVYYGILRLLGDIPGASAFWQLYKSDAVAFTLIGRTLVAALGTGTLAVVLRLGRWGYGRTTGLFALIFLSVAFLHVRDSHFITVDVPLTLFCTLAVLWALLGCCKDPGYLRWAAVAAGLATGTKYTGALALLPVGAAVWLLPGQNTKSRIRKAVACAGICILVFLITTPFAVLDWSSFWRDVRYQLFTTESSELLYGGGGPRGLVYLQQELRWGLGLPLELLALIGVGYALVRRQRSDKIILAFLIPYALFIGLWSRHWGRWILPIVPLLAVLAARFWAEQVIFRLRSRRAAAVLLPLATVLLVALPLIASVRCNGLLGRTDTRTLAYEQLAKRLDSLDGPVFLTAFSLPALEPGACDAWRYVDPEQWSTPDLNEVKAIFENQMLKDRPAFATGTPHEPRMPTLEQIQTAGRMRGRPVRLFVISSFYRDVLDEPYVSKGRPELATYREFYRDLERNSSLLYEFSPAKAGAKLPFHVENIYAPTVHLEQFERPGPRIEIREVIEE